MEEFQCGECGHMFKVEEDDWPDECPSCCHFFCGDDQCCHGEPFTPVGSLFPTSLRWMQAWRSIGARHYLDAHKDWPGADSDVADCSCLGCVGTRLRSSVDTEQSASTRRVAGSSPAGGTE